MVILWGLFDSSPTPLNHFCPSQKQQILRQYFLFLFHDLYHFMLNPCAIAYLLCNSYDSSCELKRTPRGSIFSYSSPSFNLSSPAASCRLLCH